MGGGLAFWGNELGVKVDGRSALLWGFAARVSSSEELSSEAPRMNLRRSLASDLELSIGTLSLKIFWLLSGKGGSSVFSLDKVCLCSVSAVLTFGETLLPGDLPLNSLCGEVEGTADRGVSIRAAEGLQPDRGSSSLSDITVFN